MLMLRALKPANAPWIIHGEDENAYLTISRSGEGMPESAKLRGNLHSTLESPDPFFIVYLFLFILYSNRREMSREYVY